MKTEQRAWRMEHSQMEAPSPKHQIPNKYQSPKSETKSAWVISNWNLELIWDLVIEEEDLA